MLRALSDPSGDEIRLRIPYDFQCPACGADDLGVVNFNGRPFLGLAEGQMVQHDASECGSVFEVVADGLRVLPDDEAAAVLEGNW